MNLNKKGSVLKVEKPSKENVLKNGDISKNLKRGDLSKKKGDLSRSMAAGDASKNLNGESIANTSVADADSEAGELKNIVFSDKSIS